MAHYIHIMLCAFVVGCVSLPAANDNYEDDRVISAVLTRICENSKHGHSILSTASATVEQKFIPRIIDATAATSLANRNQTSTLLIFNATCRALRVVPQIKIDGAMSKPPISSSKYRSARWASFYESFPESNGIMQMSLPGYSTDRRLAVIQVVASCDALCGSGFYWVMKKQNGVWTFVKAIPGWTS